MYFNSPYQQISRFMILYMYLLQHCPNLVSSPSKEASSILLILCNSSLLFLLSSSGCITTPSHLSHGSLIAFFKVMKTYASATD